MPNDLDLDSLACFDAAATTLNFRAAARRVHLSPAAFSGRLRKLEEQLSTELFQRTTRKVELSVSGQHLLPLARETLASARRLRVAVQSPTSPTPYAFFIGTRYELGLSWLCPALTPLSRSHPDRTLHLYNGDTPELLSRLERGDLDAIVASMRLTSPKLSYAALHPEHYLLVARRPCLRKREDARKLTLVDVSHDLPLFRYFLDALPEAEPWPFARVEYMGGIGNIRRRLLDLPNSIGVLPRYFVKGDLAARRLVSLMPRTRLRSDAFRLIWRTGHPRTAELLVLAAELRRLPLR